MQVAGKVQAAVQARPELQLLGDPVLSVVGVVFRLVSGSPLEIMCNALPVSSA